MRQSLTLSVLASLFAVASLSSFAAPAPSSTAASSTGASAQSMEARVEALRALPADQRRAELKSLSADERRGLWLELKRTQAAERRGSKAAQSGFYRDPANWSQGQHEANSPSKAPGTIRYDDGVIDNTFGGGAIIGNRFDTHDGGIPVTMSGTVDTVVAVVVQGPSFSSDSAGFVLLNEQTAGGGAMAAFSTFTAGITSTTATVTFAGLAATYTGDSFFVLFGDFSSIYIPAFGTGTTQGQGHHGVVGYTGGMGPDITSTFDFGETRNGLIRVTGNVLPVELMSFDGE